MHRRCHSPVRATPTCAALSECLRSRRKPDVARLGRNPLLAFRKFDRWALGPAFRVDGSALRPIRNPKFEIGNQWSAIAIAPCTAARGRPTSEEGETRASVEKSWITRHSRATFGIPGSTKLLDQKISFRPGALSPGEINPLELFRQRRGGLSRAAPTCFGLCALDFGL